MTVLVLEHDGYVVATSSWSAASHDNKRVTLCYEWGPDGWAWTDNRVSTARTKLPISMTTFLSLVRDGGMIDLRPHQKQS